MHPPADFQPWAAEAPAVPPLAGEVTPVSPRRGSFESVEIPRVETHGARAAEAESPDSDARSSESVEHRATPPEAPRAGVASAPSSAEVEAPASAAPNPAVDALVSSMANLIFVTTGPAACEALNLFPNQVALTPIVAERIAEVLRVVLQYPDVGTRAAIVEEWQVGELACVPGGRVEVDEHAVHVGIEPLGAGILVSVLWAHVPVLVWQLDQVARGMRGGHSG